MTVWIKDYLLPILSFSNIIATVIAGFIEKKKQSYTFTFVFAGTAVVLGLIYGIRRGDTIGIAFIVVDLLILFAAVALVLWILMSQKSLASRHRNYALRKKRFERDLKAKNNGKSNGGVCLNLRRSVLAYQNVEFTKIDHEKEFQITACVDGVVDFTDQYRYSADSFDDSENGICRLTAPLRGQCIAAVWRDGGFTHYTIHSNIPIAQGNDKTFKMRMETIDDPQRRMSPFLSTGIYEPTKKLELILKYPRQANVIDPKVRIYRTYGDQVEIDSISLNSPDNAGCTSREFSDILFCKEENEKADVVQLRFKIVYPVYGYMYKMSWFTE